MTHYWGKAALSAKGISQFSRPSCSKGKGEPIHINISQIVNTTNNCNFAHIAGLGIPEIAKINVFHIGPKTHIGLK